MLFQQRLSPFLSSNLGSKEPRNSKFQGLLLEILRIQEFTKTSPPRIYKLWIFFTLKKTLKKPHRYSRTIQGSQKLFLNVENWYSLPKTGRFALPKLPIHELIYYKFHSAGIHIFTLPYKIPSNLCTWRMKIFLFLVITFFFSPSPT